MIDVELPPTPDSREANMAALTDDEWREQHEKLRGVLPGHEFAYRWQPGQPSPAGYYPAQAPTVEDTPDAP